MGAEFQVNTFTPGTQHLASVAADADGDFVVVWQNDASGIASIQGQRYASNGTAQGAEFQINTYTTSSQRYPDVAATAAGDFVVAWESLGFPGTDTSFIAILGQRFSVPAAAPPVPAMSSATRFALGAARMLLGSAYALRCR